MKIQQCKHSSFRQPLIAVADSLSFRVADHNERGAKVQMASPDRELTLGEGGLPRLASLDSKVNQ
jgi:hypothetical protein